MKRLAHLILIVCFAAICSGGATRKQSPSSSTQAPAAAAQQTPATAAPPAAKTAEARSSDVDTLEHIIAAVYDVISGPPGPRDWDRFRSLYYPGARMIPSRRDDKGSMVARVNTPDEYAARAQEFFSKEGFFENSIANRTEVWDHLAHVWSTYESRHAKGDQPFARGINSFQLIHDGKRWWILSVYWEGEDKDHPLPEKYLK
ncbi:MAG: hypothetical protein ACHP79_06755 [Terriglobales bacterium]